MVDVLIRNVDDDLYAEFKSDAAKRKLTLGQELKLAFENLKIKMGTGRDLLSLPRFKGKNEAIRTASDNIDKIIGDALEDEYHRLQRDRRPSS